MKDIMTKYSLQIGDKNVKHLKVFQLQDLKCTKLFPLLVENSVVETDI